MGMMIAEVYDALKEAGASEDKAKATAESLANYENRFTRIEADLLAIKWMLSPLIVGVISLVIKTFLI